VLLPNSNGRVAGRIFLVESIDRRMNYDIASSSERWVLSRHSCEINNEDILLEEDAEMEFGFDAEILKIDFVCSQLYNDV
jgi:hypothetical protein